jgi:hypothetical protein
MVRAARDRDGMLRYCVEARQAVFGRSSKRTAASTSKRVSADATQGLSNDLAENV